MQYQTTTMHHDHVAAFPWRIVTVWCCVCACCRRQVLAITLHCRRTTGPCRRRGNACQQSCTACFSHSHSHSHSHSPSSAVSSHRLCEFPYGTWMHWLIITDLIDGPILTYWRNSPTNLLTYWPNTGTVLTIFFTQQKISEKWRTW